MTANQRRIKCIVRDSHQLFVIADSLKTQSEALVRRAGELKETMRLSQARMRKALLAV